MIGGHTFSKMTLDDLSCAGKTVLVHVADPARGVSKKTRATLQWLLTRHAKVVLVTEARPADPDVWRADVTATLEKVLKRPVTVFEKVHGDFVRVTVKKRNAERVFVLAPVTAARKLSENMCRQIVHDAGAVYFVEDSPERLSVGTLSRCALFAPAVLGRATEDLCTHMATLPAGKTLVVCGGEASKNTFRHLEALAGRCIVACGGEVLRAMLRTRGAYFGNTRVDASLEESAKQCQEKLGQFLFLPGMFAVVRRGDSTMSRLERPVGEIGADETVRDLGTAAIEQLLVLVRQANTIVWCGEVGDTTLSSFMHGNARLALELVQHPEKRVVVAGEKLVNFLTTWDAKNGDSFPEKYTDSQAVLALLGRTLPTGLAGLMDAHAKTSYTKEKP